MEKIFSQKMTLCSHKSQFVIACKFLILNACKVESLTWEESEVIKLLACSDDLNSSHHCSVTDTISSACK